MSAVPDIHVQAALQESFSAQIAHAQPRVLIDGTPLNFKRYGWLPRMIDDDHPHITIMKGAQIGVTTALIFRTIKRAEQGMRGAGYFFPRLTDVQDFSKTRFKRMVDENPYFRRLVQEADSSGVRKVGNTYIYLRHMGTVQAGAKTSQAALKSFPADMVVVDEYDEASQDRVDAAVHRLDGSMNPQLVKLSTPTFPEYGVDLDWQASDQHNWLIRCAACSKDNILGTEWPDCVQWKDGEPYYACPCGAELDPTEGQWVAAYPDRDKRGYWVSQLNSPTRPATVVWPDWEEYQRKGKTAEFHRQTIGLPYADATEAFTDAMLRAACNAEVPVQSASSDPVGFGADVGQKLFHWTAWKRPRAGQRQMVAFDECETENQLLDRFDKLGTGLMVIDGMAETRSVERIKERRPGSVYECHYRDDHKSNVDWDHEHGIVKIDRTMALDSVFQGLQRGEGMLPRLSDGVRTRLFPHLRNLARKTTVDDETGKRRTAWVVRGAKNDHWFHASAYGWMASEDLPTQPHREPDGYRPMGADEGLGDAAWQAL